MTLSQIQAIVGTKVDGIAGPNTTAAIKAYQRSLGVTADGIWGANTQAAYDKKMNPPKTTSSSSSSSSSNNSSSSSSSSITTKNAAYNPSTGQPLYQGQTVTYNGVKYVGTTVKQSTQTSTPSSSSSNSSTPSSTPSSSSTSSSAVGKNITSTSTSSIQSKLGVTADGIYGSNTTAAVKAFQQANGLSVDGIVGAETLAKLFPTTPINQSTPAQTTTTPINQSTPAQTPATTPAQTTTTPATTPNMSYPTTTPSTTQNMSYAPTTSSNLNTILASGNLQSGSSDSAAIKALQGYLGITADGIYGPNTIAAVKAFQSNSGLTADGIVGPQTKAAMGGTNMSLATQQQNIQNQSPAPVNTTAITVSTDNIQTGSTNTVAVKALQNFLGITADGKFGPDTLAAVKAFQTANGLTPDGIVGPATKAAISSGTSTAPAVSPENTPLDSIKQLQIDLNAENAGLPGWIPLEVDGIMGPLTQAAQNFVPVTTPTEQPLVTNVPPANIPMPTFETQTSVDTSSAYISSLTSQLTTAKNALTTAYQKEIDNAKAKETTSQAAIDAITAKEGLALNEIKDLTAPFRKDLEDAERERLHINENFEANQALTNELESLLNDGASLVNQLKGVTGLSSIRDPRVNQAIDAVNARVGVISAVMAARDNQINQAYTMIDRSVAAITADKNDQISYYNSLLSFLGSNKNTEIQKLAGFEATERTYINAKIAQLETDVNSTQATADAVKAALIDPNTALLYAKAGITLADSPATINEKLAKQTYLMEVADKNNTMQTAGYTYLEAGSSAPLGASVVSIVDSKGKQTNWYTTGSANTDAPAVVKTDAGTFQWNPATGRYDIPVGEGATGANPETMVQVKNTIAQIQALGTMDGLSAAVGPNPLARWNILEPFNSSKSNYIASVEQVVSQLSLDNLIKVKAAGGTFGALSDREMDILSGSATKLAAYRVKNGDGKVVGYDATEAQFKTELANIVSTLNSYYNRMAGTTGSTTGTGLTNTTPGTGIWDDPALWN